MPEDQGERYYYADGKKVGLTTSRRFLAVKAPDEDDGSERRDGVQVSRPRARKSSSCRSTTSP